RSQNLVLLLKQLHQVYRHGRPRCGPAGHESPATLETKQRSVESVAADMLKYHVDTFFSRELAGDSLKSLGLVIYHVVCAQRPGFVSLGVVAHSGDYRAAKSLG